MGTRRNDIPAEARVSAVDSPRVDDSVKAELTKQYGGLDMINLKQQIDTLKESLMRSVL